MVSRSDPQSKREKSKFTCEFGRSVSKANREARETVLLGKSGAAKNRKGDPQYVIGRRAGVFVKMR